MGWLGLFGSWWLVLVGVLVVFVGWLFVGGLVGLLVGGLGWFGLVCWWLVGGPPGPGCPVEPLS